MSKLSFQFIANACGIFIGKNGSKLLCDPWLVDGVFEGSWCHYPKLKTTWNDLKDIDGIYISHLHPDHFDENNFPVAKSMPLIVLDHAPNFLMKKLHQMGYENLIRVKDKETVKFKEFELTLYAPFAKNKFHESELGNLIDSAIIVSCDGITALNANDNTLTPDACKNIKNVFPNLDLVMLNYNAAGPYPSCFDNLSVAEKKSEHNRIIQRNFAYMKELVLELRPRFVLPFAGAYVIGGNLHYKNDYLGTTTWDECGEYLEKAGISPSRVVLLRERDTFDIEKGVSDKPYIPIDVEDMKHYIENVLSQMKYPHEEDDIPEKSKLFSDMEGSYTAMKQRWSRFNIQSKFNIYVRVFEKVVKIYPEFKVLDEVETLENTLICTLDERLLNRIIYRKASWNSAEIGTHISLIRKPNVYEPDLHTGLQFFHL